MGACKTCKVQKLWSMLSASSELSLPGAWLSWMMLGWRNCEWSTRAFISAQWNRKKKQNMCEFSWYHLWIDDANLFFWLRISSFLSCHSFSRVFPYLCIKGDSRSRGASPPWCLRQRLIQLSEVLTSVKEEAMNAHWCVQLRGMGVAGMIINSYSATCRWDDY